MEKKKIGILVGSLRRGSFCRKTAKAMQSLMPETMEAEEIEIGQLPLYNQDFDDDGMPPAEWEAFREKLKTFDAFLFVTPEYNRSTSAVLKNAVDVGSRPFGKNRWNRRPAAVVSVSPGAIGGFGANHSLRQSLVCLNVATMPGPELYLGNAAAIFSEDGAIAEEKTREILQKFINAYAIWIETNEFHKVQ